MNFIVKNLKAGWNQDGGGWKTLTSLVLFFLMLCALDARAWNANNVEVDGALTTGNLPVATGSKKVGDSGVSASGLAAQVASNAATLALGFSFVTNPVVATVSQGTAGNVVSGAGVKTAFAAQDATNAEQATANAMFLKMNFDNQSTNVPGASFGLQSIVFAENVESNLVGTGFPITTSTGSRPVSWSIISQGLTNRTAQIAMQTFFQEPRMFIRARHDTTWSAWKELLQGFVIATGTANSVSTNGGVVTLTLNTNTLTNIVRINSEVIITNDSVWTGWTTTGDLLSNGAIFITEGEYLQSPVQTNGISSYRFSAVSDGNGTAADVTLLAGTNEVSNPYFGTSAVLKIIAGRPLPGTTDGVSISNLIIIGYGDAVEAASVKMVSGLKIIDPPSADNDAVNKKYSDAGDASVAGFAVAQVEAYSADDTKTVRGAQLRLNRSWMASTANGQDWILSCGEVAGNGQLLGTSNYFALAQNDYPLLTFSADATGLFISSNSIAYPDSTNRTVTLYVATNGVTAQPYAEWTKNLMVGEWTRVMSYATNTYPAVSGSNYVLRFTAPSGATGFFRALQPSGQSRITVSANILDLGSNVIKNVSYISFTNGWKIVCSTNGLQFVAP